MNDIDRLINDHWGGSTKAVQAALGVSKQTVSEWRRKGIPPLRAAQIELWLLKNTPPPPAATPFGGPSPD